MRVDNGENVRVVRKPKPGVVVQVPMPNGRFAYGRVHRDATICFYRQTSDAPRHPPIGARDFAFCVGVYDDVVAGWQRLGEDPFTSEDEEWPPPTSIQDPITGRWSIYERGHIRPAQSSEAEGLERAAVWDEHHLMARLSHDLGGS